MKTSMSSHTPALPFDANYIPPAPYLSVSSAKTTDEGLSVPVTQALKGSQPSGSHSNDTITNGVSRDENPKSKKLRLYPGSSEDSKETSAPWTTSCVTGPRIPLKSLFTRLPLEILAEILSLTSSPKDLLSVARTCKALCEQLLSPGATFVWKNMRVKVGLPDPQEFLSEFPTREPGNRSFSPFSSRVGLFDGRESAYAAFVFDGGLCEYCGNETENMCSSYSLRVHLCELSDCRLQFRANRLVSHTHHTFASHITGDDALSAWFTSPVLESSSPLCSEEDFRVSRISIPEIMLERLCLEEESGEPRNRRYNLRKRTRLREPALLNEPLRLTAASNERLGIAFAKTGAWMKFCCALVAWQSRWLERIKEVLHSHKRTGTIFSIQLDCKYSELIHHSSFGEFAKQKALSHEIISDEDLDRLRPAVVQEIYEYREKQDKKIIMGLKKNNISQIWRYYQRLLCQKYDDNTGLAFPTFPVFLSLPAVQFLRSPDLADAKVSMKTATSKQEGFINDMVKHQLRKWTNQVKMDLLKTIDPPDAIVKEWKKRMLTSTTPPQVCGPNAWWKCRVCNTVETCYALNECLDFRGVCRHQCKEKDGKMKRRGTVSQPWSVDNFVRDEQACGVMASCLEKLNLSRMSNSEIVDSMVFALWLCKSCDPPLLVQQESLVGHSHRHTGQTDIEMVTQTTDLTCHPAKPMFLGLAQWLTFNSQGTTTDWVGMKNYSCTPCLANKIQGEVQAGEQPLASTNMTPSGMTKLKAQEMMRNMNKLNFNGLRSHLASKHKVYKIRDEDFYCHQSIDDYPGSVLSARRIFWRSIRKYYANI